ncbi:MAG: TrkH family potassium uptake protein [Ruminococcaceae bacterium]|nr:TrkH family potassium uptake protein [Oscillospiraceae bacterium]
MNYRMIRYITGQLLLVEGALMLLPLAVSLIYGETETVVAFVLPILILAVLGTGMVIFKPKNQTIRAKDGFVVVGLSWIALSLFGCIPYIVSGLIPNFVDAFFETVSGFTTTGSSVLFAENFARLWSPESAAVGMRGVFFWRSFTNWIGGMGVLVFVLVVMPQQDMKSSRLVHVMRAEMPGPKVDKIVATVKKTSAIMYGIYTFMTAILVILLLFGGMDLYESLCSAFATAGTGGFSIWSDSMISYGGGANVDFCTWVIAIFMFLFGVNFNVYFLVLTGKLATALFSEELIWYTGIVIGSTAIVTYNIYSIYGDFAESLKQAFFQVSTVITTTGFATADFNIWPSSSKALLLLLMFVGACAGSTGGGMKVSRLVIAFKSAVAEIKHMGRPRQVSRIRFEGKPVEKDTINGVFAFIISYIFIFFGSFLIISVVDGKTIETTFSSVAACINNIGPGLGDAGPMANYAFYSPISKLILAFDMLLGRLEIFPIIMLFSPSVWTEK